MAKPRLYQSKLSEEKLQSVIMKLKEKMSFIDNLEKVNEHVNNPIIAKQLQKAREDISDFITLITQKYKIDVIDIWSKIGSDLIISQMKQAKQQQQQDLERGVESEELFDLVDEFGQLVTHNKKDAEINDILKHDDILRRYIESLPEGSTVRQEQWFTDRLQPNETKQDYIERLKLQHRAEEGESEEQHNARMKKLKKESKAKLQAYVKKIGKQKAGTKVNIPSQAEIQKHQQYAQQQQEYSEQQEEKRRRHEEQKQLEAELEAERKREQLLTMLTGIERAKRKARKQEEKKQKAEQEMKYLEEQNRKAKGKKLYQALEHKMQQSLGQSMQKIEEHGVVKEQKDIQRLKRLISKLSDQEKQDLLGFGFDPGQSVVSPQTRVFKSVEGSEIEGEELKRSEELLEKTQTPTTQAETHFWQQEQLEKLQNKQREDNINKIKHQGQTIKNKNGKPILNSKAAYENVDIQSLKAFFSQYIQQEDVEKAIPQIDAKNKKMSLTHMIEEIKKNLIEQGARYKQ